MELSKRLHGVASLVTPGSKIADIGTDHAYIPIYLMEENIAAAAIAMDINPGPLERAAEHVRLHGLEDKIDLRLSNGFEKLQPGEVHSAIIAGMGGDLMMRILSAHQEVTFSIKEFVLQPQSEVMKFRTFLLEKGFFFMNEDMLYDAGKYYPVMKVLPPEKGEKRPACWTQTELRYGRLLLEMRHPVLKDYLEREKRINAAILLKLEKETGEHIEQRKQELLAEQKLIQEGLRYYDL